MILTSSQRRIAVLALCLAGFGLTVTFYYPGFMSYDSVEQLFDARRGIYGDAHPPFMAFLWGSLDKLIPGSFGILLFQSLLIWSGVALIALGWFDAPNRSAGWLAVPALLVLYPPIFGIAGAIWKDLSMLGFFMIAIGCAGTIKPAGARWLPFVVAASALSCAVLLRHNAIFAAMPLIILCLYRLRTKGAFRIPISIAGGVLASILLLLATTSFNASLAKVHREPWAWIAIFNIAGVLEHMHDRPQQQAIYDAVPEQLRANGLDAVLASYRPRYVLTLFDSDRPAFACPTGGNGGPPGHHLSKFETCFEMK